MGTDPVRGWMGWLGWMGTDPAQSEHTDGDRPCTGCCRESVLVVMLRVRRARITAQKFQKEPEGIMMQQ